MSRLNIRPAHPEDSPYLFKIHGNAALLAFGRITCNPPVSPDGSATGMVSTGNPARLAGVVSVRSALRASGVQSALRKAGKGVAGRIK